MLRSHQVELCFRCRYAPLHFEQHTPLAQEKSCNCCSYHFSLSLSNRRNAFLVKNDGTFDFQTLVDADFAGLFGRESSENPNTARLQYGYITTFRGVPLFWKSQLISEIYLSTFYTLNKLGWEMNFMI